MHHELAVESLLWFVDFAMEKHCRSSDAVQQQLLELIPIRYIYGTYGQLNLGGVADFKELARQIQVFIDPYSDPDNVSLSDSRFDSGSQELETLAAFLR